MTNMTSSSQNRLIRHYVRPVGQMLKVGAIYSLLAIAMAYTAVVMLVVAVIGVVATPILSIASLVLNPIGDSIFPRP